MPAPDTFDHRAPTGIFDERNKRFFPDIPPSINKRFQSYEVMFSAFSDTPVDVP
jgi:hypothetical protein